MGRSVPWIPIILLWVFGISGGIIWLAFSEAGTVYGEPPLVQAAVEPLKRTPEEPGGRELAALEGVNDLLREPASGPDLEPPAEAPGSELLMPSPRRPRDPAVAAVASLSPGADVNELKPDPQKRSEASAALQAIIAEVKSDDPPIGADPEPVDPGLGVNGGGTGGPASPARAMIDALLAQGNPPRPNEPETLDKPGATAPEGALVALQNDVASGRSEASATGRFRVQLAAVRAETDAHQAWASLQASLGPPIDAWQPIIERAETSNGTFYRIQIGPFLEAREAEQLCSELQQKNASCFVVQR